MHQKALTLALYRRKYFSYSPTLTLPLGGGNVCVLFFTEPPFPVCPELVEGRGKGRGWGRSGEYESRSDIEITVHFLSSQAFPHHPRLHNIPPQFFLFFAAFHSIIYRRCEIPMNHMMRLFGA